MSANIEINGTQLTASQKVILRCALTSYHSDISLNGLGEDELGKQMTEVTIGRIDEILTLILRE